MVWVWLSYQLHLSRFFYLNNPLQILMMDLDSKLLSRFSTASFDSAQALDKAMGIDTIIPGTLIDSFIFDPCGYSANGIIKVFFFCSYQNCMHYIFFYSLG